MKRLLLLPLLALLCMQACKKDDPADNEPKATSADYFFPLKVGNYWVYETLNTQDNSTTTDTIRVLSDTLVNGRTFYRFNSLSPVIFGVSQEYLLADSNGYVIDPTGFVYMTNNGTRDTVEITSGSTFDIVIKTGNRDTTVNVPAGSFQALETVTDVYYKSITSPTGVNPRTMYGYAAKNVGPVKSIYFYTASASHFVITLKSYHLEP